MRLKDLILPLIKRLVALLAKVNASFFLRIGLRHAVIGLVVHRHVRYFILDFRLVLVNLDNMRSKMIFGGTGFITITAGHVGVTLVYPIDVFPKVRSAAVALVTKVTRIKRMGTATMITEFFIGLELETVALFANERNVDGFGRCGESILQVYWHLWETLKVKNLLDNVTKTDTHTFFYILGKSLIETSLMTKFSLTTAEFNASPSSP